MSTDLPGNLKEVANTLSGLRIDEVALLIKFLESEWGVSASAPMMAVASAPVIEAPVEEKTEFDVILSAAGEKKIEVIKEVRSLTGLGLKEAKDLVEGAPKVLKEGISQEEAGKIKQKLEAVGARVDLK